MLDFLSPLEIFPQGSLSSSVITTVWVGVFVVAFFNLRFGWVLSGLVVPGYLIPLLLIKPWAESLFLLRALLPIILSGSFLSIFLVMVFGVPFLGVIGFLP